MKNLLSKSEPKNEPLQALIGESAGNVWYYLNQNGETSLSKMKRDLDLAGNLCEFAIGWLAREDKLEVVKKGLQLKIKLK